MESEIYTTPSIRYTQSINKHVLEKQVDRIKEAAELAQRRMDYDSAHNDHIQLAIEVVEAFLRKKHRLCYGGQAINAHLPDRHQFYDREYSVPDYDFFTPSQESDIQVLVHDLRQAGFSEISAREGMHEGTVKIYVDYIPVADITAMDAKLYSILSSREFRKDGISYMDANSLRMMMYLELSRPRGEVSRWPKVYERLALFNEYASHKKCKADTSSIELIHGEMSANQVHAVLQWMIDQKRIFAGGDLLTFYRQVWKDRTKSIEWIFRSRKPILFYSPEPEKDAEYLAGEFRLLDAQASQINGGSPKKKITVKTKASKGVEILPAMTTIQRGTLPLVIIIHQTACHSYFTVPMKDHRVLRIASMDTLITLYFSLGLLDTSYFDMGSMECLANQLVELSIKTRKHAEQFRFPFISITCSGHQTSMSSLIRSKVERIMHKQKALRSVLRKATRRSTSTKRRKTVRPKRHRGH